MVSLLQNTSLFYSAIGVLLPYLVVYMQDIGLSPSECAIIMSVSMIVTAPVRTIIGMAADKLRRHIDILIVCCFFTAALYLAMLFVPRLQHHRGETGTFVTVQCLDASSRKLASTCDATRTPGMLNESESSLSTGTSNALQEPFDGSISAGVTLNPDRCAVFCCSDYINSLTDQKPSINQTADDKPNDTECYVSVVVNHIELMCAVLISNSTSERTVSLMTNNSNGDFSNMCNEPTEQSCTEACKIVANETKPELHRNQQSPPPESMLFGQTFWIFFALNFVGSCAFSPIFSIIDGLAYGCLGHNSSKFGQQRLWGSVGFGLFAVLSGVMMDAFQTNEADKNYTISFFLFVAFIIATAVSGYRMQPSSDQTVTGGVMTNIGRILCNLELDILLLAAFVSGYMCGVQESFLFWFLSSLGGPHALMGISMVIQCISETILLVLSGHVVEKLGTNWCLCAAFAAYGLRFVLYSFLVNPWCVLSIEPLHSICFGLLYPTMTNRASELTPPGMHATVQGLVGTLYNCIGR